ncbi:MAG TPA: M48 family metallopeptidase [Thermoguttaceae bacterium]|nr:M48 family metallopeptidase [Thermoguttaceae bacterium]
MDFFEQQADARRRSGRLIVYFILAVVAIVLAVYFVALIALSMAGGDRPGVPNPYAESPWHPGLFALVALATIGLIFLGSLYKISQLSSGGEAVALMLGGRLIDSQTRDLAERRLLNVVEEMALASGTPVPPVYVMDNEPSINAFAAGHEPGDAVIGVSRGSLEYLNRDELQGVMAHEFSHILNGDMRTNLRLVGILHGILILAILGWFVLRSTAFSGHRSRRSSSSKEGGGAVAVILVVGVGLLVVGSIGLFFGKLIKSAVSRQREYLADASAVQFTRLPEGIAGALKKIGGRKESSKIEDAHAEEVSHMFFGNAFGSLQSNLLSTHPPLAERVRRIDPSFDGNFPKRVKPVKIAADEVGAKPRKKPGKPLEAIGAGGTTPLDPTGVLRRIGLPGMEAILYAAALLESMPEPVRNAAHEPYGARAVIYALLLDRDPQMRQKQLDALRPKAEELSYRETERLAPQIDRLPDEARVPLIETTFPALKKLSPEQYTRFRENVELLIAADEQVDLLEYTIHSMLLRNLDVQFGRAKPLAVRHHRLDPLLPSLVAVLSMLAHAGQTDEADVRRAFDKGMAEVGRSGTLQSKSEGSLRNLDAALKSLAEAGPKLKKQILAACVACVAADGKVTPREGELVQAVAAMLGVPVPPIGAQA